jgi:hypothetical protein
VRAFIVAPVVLLWVIAVAVLEREHARPDRHHPVFVVVTDRFAARPTDAPLKLARERLPARRAFIAAVFDIRLVCHGGVSSRP